MTFRNQMAAVVALILASGCVSQGKYDTALADAARVRSELELERAQSQQRLGAQERQIAALRRQIELADQSCSRVLGDLSTEAGRATACAEALDEATIMNATLRSELDRLGRNADELLAAKGTLASSLDQARKRLSELRRLQADAEARAAMFRDVALRLKKMIDAGDLRVVLRGGRMVLALPNDVLFDSGKTEIKPSGREALTQIAGVLSTLGDRHFQVAGHTDDQPIRFSGFESNWQLSVERGLRVVELLIKAGMRPEALSAAGYGEFDPYRPNDSPENRSLNRRIEITLQPNINETVPLPEPL
jgi:chemotaxis protein MotB